MRKGQFNKYCKYGHLKAGDNLRLRHRVHKDGRVQIEHVCWTCLNQQKRDWDARHRSTESLTQRINEERYLQAKLKREAVKEML